MTGAINIGAADAGGSGAAVPLMLTELRLPTIKRLWADLAAQSNREGWPAERLLHTLLGHEMAERETRRHEPTANCHQARAWRSSTSRQCRRCPRRM